MDPGSKSQIRRRVLALRRQISREVALAHARSAASAVLELPEVRSAALVMLYLTYRSEMPTEPLVDALAGRGVALAVPYVARGSRNLVPVEYTPGMPLEPGPYGVPQPANQVSIPFERVSLVVAPGVAFDMRGYRLGYGQGYYDRFLSSPGLANAVTVGLAFEAQVVPALPHEPHDVRVHVLVTEARVVRFGA